MSKVTLSAFLLVVWLSGCSEKSEKVGHACVVESGVGAHYCIVDADRSTCQEHGVSLSSETVTYYEDTDCRVAGFTQFCGELDVYITAEDDCSDIGEEWALEGAGGAGGGQP